jgi:hypothetical protein
MKKYKAELIGAILVPCVVFIGTTSPAWETLLVSVVVGALFGWVFKYGFLVKYQEHNSK